ncbi:hypothetical protein MTO96_039881, partial [Rhipicephalus appendiculatus]
MVVGRTWMHCLRKFRSLEEERRLEAAKANPKPGEIEASNQTPELVEQVPRVGLTKAKRKVPLKRRATLDETETYLADTGLKLSP